MPEHEYRAKQAANHRKWAAELRAETLNAYGGAICACCGERNERFLCLDHIASDGAQKRRESGKSGWAYLSRLRRLGFPPGYQVLCFNCNCGRAYNGGICPHKEQV